MFLDSLYHKIYLHIKYCVLMYINTHIYARQKSTYFFTECLLKQTFRSLANTASNVFLLWWNFPNAWTVVLTNRKISYLHIGKPFLVVHIDFLENSYLLILSFFPQCPIGYQNRFFPLNWTFSNTKNPKILSCQKSPNKIGCVPVQFRF